MLDFSSHRLDAGHHARAVASAVELHCVATDVDSCTPYDLTGFADAAEQRTALLASSRLPWIGGEPVHFRGRGWLDGGLCDPVPLQAALAATDAPAERPPHILGIAVRPGTPLPSRPDRDAARLRAAASLAHRAAVEALAPAVTGPSGRPSGAGHRAP